MARKSWVVPLVLALALAFSAGNAFAIAQNKGQQKCITKVNKNGSKVAKAQGKDSFKCILFAGKGKLPKLGATNPDDCLTTDSKGKVQKKKDKTVQFADKFCTEAERRPGLRRSFRHHRRHRERCRGRSGARAGRGRLWLQPHRVAGRLRHRQGRCKCQAKVVKDMTKLADAKLKEFIKCKKFALKAKGKLPFPNGATSAADLETCVDDAGTPGSIAADSKGKILKKADKIAKDVFKKCANAKSGPVDMSAAFPGDCAGEDASGGETLAANAFAQCVDRHVECRVCLMINQMDNLNVDCDLFDDGVANSSCGGGALACPLTPGSYTITQVSGGTLKVSTFAPFAFPTGGTIVQDVGAGGCQLRAPDRRPVPGRLQRADLLRACARLLGPHRPDRLWRRRDRLGRRLRLHRHRAR